MKQNCDEYQIEKDCKHLWRYTPSIREEFSSLETYIAYTKAKASDQIKMLGGNENG